MDCGCGCDVPCWFVVLCLLFSVGVLCFRFRLLVFSGCLLDYSLLGVLRLGVLCLLFWYGGLLVDSCG